MHYDFDIGNPLREQINAITANFKDQLSLSLSFPEVPRLAIDVELELFLDKQEAIWKQFEELISLPDLPQIINLEKLSKSFNLSPNINSFDNVLSNKGYLAKDFLYTQEDTPSISDLNDALVEINNTYTNDILDSHQKKTYDKIKNVIGNITYAAFNFTLSATTFYSNKAYREIADKYADTKWKKSVLELSQSIYGDYINQTIAELIFNNPIDNSINAIFFLKAVVTILFLFISKDQ